MASDTSRILTLVFTDLADSTALKTARGDVAVGDLISRHREQVVRLAQACSGRVIDWAGDGCFLTFETSSAAVMFALRLQQAHADDGELPGVRVGIHLGEVTEKPGPGEAPRIEGLAVDIAARISGLATPGQVLMSSAVYDSARQRIGIDALGTPILWQAHGAYALKGLDKELEIGEAGLEGFAPLEAPKSVEKARLVRRAKSRNAAGKSPKDRPASGAPRWAYALIVVLLIAVGLLAARGLHEPSTSETPVSTEESAPITSLAVLPLDNLMNDPAQDYFSDGMTEAITAELAKIKALKVISRTSVMRYKNTELSMPEIAAELGVEGLIEGSVLRDGDDVRITVQLIDGRTDMHVWSESYTNTITSVLKLQAEVALAIVGEIRATLTPEERERIETAREVDPEAYELYLQGLQGLTNQSPLGMQRARQLFTRATEIDPGFAPAWAYLATVNIVTANVGAGSPGTYFDAAYKAALRAIELDPSYAETHVDLGYLEFLREQDWDAAKTHLAAALALGPNQVGVHIIQCYYYALVGDFDRASGNARRVLELDPYTPFDASAARMMLVVMGHTEEGLPGLEAQVERSPEDIQAYYMLSLAYLSSGRFEDSLRAADRFVALTAGSPFSRTQRAIVLAASGRETEARAILEGLERNVSNDALASTVISMAYARLGNLDKAFEWLGAGADDPNMQYLVSLRLFPYASIVIDDPNMVRFRSDPRYHAFIEQEHFPALSPGHPGYEEEQAWFARKAEMEAANAPIEKIAVLPFDNMSGDADQEWFVDGMTEALTMELAKIGALTVVSRTSAMQFKNVVRPMQEIAQELGVDALIEGSVMKVGDNVRITAQLIDGRSDKHLWADRYDGTFENLFSLQSKVALAIAKEIDVVLTPEEETRLRSSRDVSSEAHEAYLRGRHLWNKRTRGNMLRAIAYFEEAVDEDPEFALAHAAISDAYNLLGIYFYLPPEEAFDKAIASARRALAIDDTLADAHTSLGYALGFGYFDLEGATRELDRALELDPKSVQAYAWYGVVQLYMNQPQKGLELVDHALALDPLSPISNAIKVNALTALGQEDQAIAIGRSFEELDPDFFPLLWWLGQALLTAGNHDEAIAVYERLVELSGRHAGFLCYLGRAYAEAGKRDKALAILEELEGKGVTEATEAYGRALIYFGLGDIEQTLTLLERSAGERHRGILEMYSGHVWDSLRDEPRFQAILNKFGFADLEKANEPGMANVKTKGMTNGRAADR